MEQERLIERVRQVCRADLDLVAALMYGSFAAGTGDEHSDVEFWLFFRPDRLSAVDRLAWCGRVARVLLHVRNEFGTDVVVFPGLIRGEFHFAGTGDIASLREWPARGAPVDAMVLLDRDGTLRSTLESVRERPEVPGDGAAAAELCGRFANWLLLAYHCTARGEYLRAVDALGHADRCLLWLVRLADGATGHWLTPSRAAEVELAPDVVAALRRATAAAEPDALHRALGAAWRLGRSRWTELAGRYGSAVPAGLFAEVDAALG
jgi:lincosamide nucleotidyltransferase